MLSLKHQEVPSDIYSIDDHNYGRFSPVDMLFNVGRTEGFRARGWDVIDPATNERYYVTQSSSEESERLVTSHLGSQALLERLGSNGDLSVHSVPKGSRLLLKVLEVAPYNQAYMRRLTNSASRFIDELHRVDPHGFGIELGHLAIAHNGSAEDEVDESYLTIVPPLAMPAGDK